MFGTQIHPITFFFILLQITISFLSFFNWLRNPKEKDRVRYIFVVISFLAYNITSGIIPDENLHFNRIAQDIIAYTVGISCAVYFLYYLYKDFKIKPVKFLSANTVLAILGLDFLFLFIIPYIITYNLNISRNLFLIIPILICFAALSNINYYLYNDFSKEQNWYYKARIFCGAFAMLSLISFPLTIIIFGDNQPIEHTVFNLGFISVSISYILKIRYLTDINARIKKQMNSSAKDKIHINDKEKEIIYLILTNPNKTYDELVEKYFSENNLQLLKSKLYKVLNHLDDDEVLHKIEYKILQQFKNYQFSNREIEVATLILNYTKYKDIANKMSVTEKTISKHASNIFKKTEVKNKTEFIELFKMSHTQT
ncbi:membrane hypothetical protein [Tenacibaculum sediminilitoris]|uniref:helix-turn-helix domain-containing protein n=1 Tax=Tenacibaculum sediminilitoris TaxID=1820334 RepID=UPI00389496A9